LFVIAAGNDGGKATVSSPASADAALAVGAVDKSDHLAGFSSQGPRVGDEAIKPDLTAPGVAITAARGKDGIFGAPGESYTTLSGTSMATPHVAGSAAILAQEHPDWTAEALKTALMGSAKTDPELDVFAQGAGRVDVAAAVAQTVTVDGGSVSFPQQPWPHNDDAPVTKTLTVHNRGGTEVSLDLTLDASGPGGTAVPAGMFTLGAATVQVPAGGQAQLTLTVDTRLGTDDGLYTGHLAASSHGTVAARIPFAVHREKESYELTVNHINHDGEPATGYSYSALIYAVDSDAVFPIGDPSGSATIRLPKGRYGIGSVMFGMDSSTIMADPRLDLTSTSTLTVDARSAKPLAITVPDPSAKGVHVKVGAASLTPNSPFWFSLVAPGIDGVYTGQSGPEQTVDTFSSYLIGALAEVGPDGSADNSPYTYNVAWSFLGRMLNGVQKRVAKEDLATVKIDVARLTGTQADLTTIGMLPGQLGGGGVGMTYPLPFTRTEYNTTEDGVVWTKLLTETTTSPDGEESTSYVQGESGAQQAGHTYQEKWNRGVFGPAFPAQQHPEEWITRLGDSISAVSPLYSDGAGRMGYADGDVTLTLYRDGVKLAESTIPRGAYPRAVFQVPPPEATYRLVIEASRPAPATMSVRTITAWTFRSSHVSGDTPVRQPLSVVRFSPDLNAFNHAPAGQRIGVPVTVQTQPDSLAKPVRNLSVEVSFDDGKTWCPAPLTHGPGSQLVMITSPKGEGAVSLRAKAVDQAGNQIEETIIRNHTITTALDEQNFEPLTAQRMERVRHDNETQKIIGRRGSMLPPSGCPAHGPCRSLSGSSPAAP
jgi:hypothetical protein